MDVLESVVLTSYASIYSAFAFGNNSVFTSLELEVSLELSVKVSHPLLTCGLVKANHLQIISILTRMMLRKGKLLELVHVNCKTPRRFSLNSYSLRAWEILLSLFLGRWCFNFSFIIMNCITDF